LHRFRLPPTPIQSFEYSYELSHSLIRKTLREFVNVKKVQDAFYKDVMRYAQDHGLIRDMEAWNEYRLKRNITSHTYNEEQAEEVFAVLPSFVNDVHYFLAACRRGKMQTDRPLLLVKEEDRALVDKILRVFGEGLEVWAFGSRVHGDHVRETSDLDLVGSRMHRSPRAVWASYKMRSVFSWLPFRVDIVEWARIDEDFKDIIKQDYVILQSANEKD
jgi:nucleotidyltransferase substrate binding protein (TIGR01987 family)